MAMTLNWVANDALAGTDWATLVGGWREIPQCDCNLCKAKREGKKASSATEQNVAKGKLSNYKSPDFMKR